MPHSPIRAGFQAISRQPGIALAEIVWRWSFGIATLALLGISTMELLHSIPVTEADTTMLKSRVPMLIVIALIDMFQGTSARILWMTAILVPALLILWVVAATLGRAATLTPLLPERPRVRSLLGIHFLRAMLGLAGFLGFVAMSILAARISADPRVSAPALLAGLALIGIVWGLLNWFLVIAPIFTVEGDTLSAVGRAVLFVRERSADLVGVTTVFGLLHFGALVIATIAASIPFAMFRISGVGPAVVISVIVAMIYFAIVDYLFVARMAAFIDIAEAKETVATAEPQSAPIVPAATPIAGATEEGGTPS